jgi:hypothetical protein
VDAQLANPGATIQYHHTSGTPALSLSWELEEMEGRLLFEQKVVAVGAPAVPSPVPPEVAMVLVSQGEQRAHQRWFGLDLDLH